MGSRGSCCRRSSDAIAGGCIHGSACGAASFMSARGRRGVRRAVASTSCQSSLRPRRFAPRGRRSGSELDASSSGGVAGVRALLLVRRAPWSSALRTVPRVGARPRRRDAPSSPRRRDLHPVRRHLRRRRVRVRRVPPGGDRAAPCPLHTTFWRGPQAVLLHGVRGGRTQRPDLHRARWGVLECRDLSRVNAASAASVSVAVQHYSRNAPWMRCS